MSNTVIFNVTHHEQCHSQSEQQFIYIPFIQNISKIQLKFELHSLRLNQIITKLSKQARFITTLYLQGSILSNQSVQLLCQSKFKFITDLNLRNTCITDQALSRFRQGSWDYLKLLNLGNNKLSNKSTSYLAKCSLNKLEYFILDQTSLTNQGFKNLQKLHLPKLKYLSLCESLVGHVDFKFLTLTNWNSLQKIDLHIDSKHNNFIWCSLLSKFPQSLRDIQITVFSSQIKCNSYKAILNLGKAFENAHQLDYSWQQNYGVNNDRQTDFQ